MVIPVRILRAESEALDGGKRQLSTREMAVEKFIMDAGQALMSRHGRHSLTVGSFASAIRISPHTIRRYFCDLDALLGEILTRHLNSISAAIGQIPFDTPNCQAARRAAYIAATRTPFRAPTEAHLLLVRERHTLPVDLSEPLEKFRLSIGDLLAGPDASVALALLDMPELDGPQIEAMLAALDQPAITTPALAAPKPKPAKHLAPKLEVLPAEAGDWPWPWPKPTETETTTETPAPKSRAGPH